MIVMQNIIIVGTDNKKRCRIFLQLEEWSVCSIKLYSFCSFRGMMDCLFVTELALLGFNQIELFESNYSSILQENTFIDMIPMHCCCMYMCTRAVIICVMCLLYFHAGGNSGVYISNIRELLDVHVDLNWKWSNTHLIHPHTSPHTHIYTWMTICSKMWRDDFTIWNIVCVCNHNRIKISIMQKREGWKVIHSFSKSSNINQLND